MSRTSRVLVPAVAILAGAVSLKADAVRFTGVVKTKSGKPVAGAHIMLERLDISWKVEFTTDADGRFARAGVTPLADPVYQLTISKDGFVTTHEKLVISFSNEDSRKKEFVLLTPQEAVSEGGPSVSPGAAEAEKARAAFNAAAPLYNQKQYAEALPGLEAAYKGMTKAEGEAEDDMTKASIQDGLTLMTKVYGITLHKLNRDDEAVTLLAQIVDADPKNVKNGDAMKTLVEIFEAKKDAANLAKYQAILNAAAGVSNGLAPYNEGVSAFNAGRMKEAKIQLQKAIAADPAFADSYYLLGLVEMNQGNLPAAKGHFKKYLDLAPNGKHAQEVKDALSAL